MDAEVIQRIRSQYEGDAGRRWRRIAQARPQGYLEQNIVIGRRRLGERLLGWLAQERPSRILDAGCGLGTLALEMGNSGAAVTGVDLVPEFVDEARRVAEPDGPTFAVGDFVRLLEESEKPVPFDAVTMIEILEDYSPSEREELLKRVASSGIDRLYLAFRSTGYGAPGIWNHLTREAERDISEIELLRGIHLATPFRQKRQAKINVRNYRVHLSDLRREG